MKKLLALILAGIMIFCFVACAKNDEDDTDNDKDDAPLTNDQMYVETVGTFTFANNADGDYEIVKFTPASVATVDITLPKQTSDGRDVVGVGSGAFTAQNTVKTLTFPDTYTYIGDHAFRDCDSLTTVTMANTITTVGAMAFADCNELTSVTVSTALDSIGQFAFRSCNKLTSIDLSSVSTVSTAAFAQCSELATVTLSDKIKTISMDSFAGCNKLAYTVDTVGNAKYLGNADAPYLVLISGLNSEIKTCTVNVNTKVIALGAFANYKKLTTITLGNSVTTISSECFTGCEVLQYNTAEGTRYLGSTSNPYMVLVELAIHSSANATVNANTKIIMDTAFKNCVNLTAISFAGDTEAWNAIIKSADWNNGHEIEIIDSRLITE